jgi:hypothetical protein
MTFLCRGGAGLSLQIESPLESRARIRQIPGLCLTDFSIQDPTRELLGIQQKGLSQTPEGVKCSDVVPF